MPTYSADDPRNPAFAPVTDLPHLPRILLIGDSISIGYTLTVRERLAGKANVHRIPENGRDTSHGLENLIRWLGNTRWDLIHFNFGLHDIRRIRDDRMDVTGVRVRSVEEYAANLRQILDQLKNTGARLLFATTTPVPEGADGRLPGDESEVNRRAVALMTEAGVSVTDLHGFIRPYLASVQLPANVHFTGEGSRLLGEEVARTINRTLRLA
ncbi:MAG: SGNH/GDSL hydrolase family protein [Opitutaceae bacterium]